MEKNIETDQEKETRALGFRMGQEAAAGSVFALDGDLGVGKTVFAQGFAAGLGITEPVSSPTFTIVQCYEEGRLPLYHMDVYRLEEEEELEAIGADEYFYGDGVCLVEWGSMVRGLLPPHTVYIRIEKDPARGTDFRRITVSEEAE